MHVSGLLLLGGNGRSLKTRDQFSLAKNLWSMSLQNNLLWNFTNLSDKLRIYFPYKCLTCLQFAWYLNIVFIDYTHDKRKWHFPLLICNLLINLVFVGKFFKGFILQPIYHLKLLLLRSNSSIVVLVEFGPNSNSLKLSLLKWQK